MKLFAKIILIILAVAVIGSIYFYLQFKPAEQVNFGVSFSTKAASGLGFDPKVEFLDILNDLKPQKMRLVAYWDEIEPTRGNFTFQQMDEFLTETDKRNMDIVLVLGHKEPRWPECHQPEWFNGLNPQQQREALFNMLTNATNHFKQFSSVKIWQIENEPYFGFGPMCDKIPAETLKQEVDLVKSLDTRPVMLTDSGEKGNWTKTAKTGADILGVTMYRVVVDKWFGYEKYPLPALYYRVYAGVLEKVAHVPVVGIELQAEPWVTAGFEQVNLNDQLAVMNPKVFNENIKYAKAAGFEDNYLWGVEWWYWLAQKKNDWGMWDAAKKVITQI